MLLRSARVRFRGNFVESPNVSTPGLVIPPEASRVQSHRSPGGVDLRGLMPCPSKPSMPPDRCLAASDRPRRAFRDPPYTPGDAPSVRPPRGSRRCSPHAGGQTAAGPDRPVRILSGSPTTLDPAAQGDAGSAAITAQLFESLTSFDADLQVRPALAESWRFSDDGRQVMFHLRPDLTFSDGSPLAAIRRRAQLAAPDRSRPTRRRWPRSSSTSPAPRPTCAARPPTRRRSGCTPTTRAGDLVVDLVRPATDFVNIVAGPTFSVVPPGVGSERRGA